MTAPEIDLAETMRAFAEAFGSTKIGPKIQFNDRVDISAGDLYAAVVAELDLAQFGEEDRRDWFGEQLVQRIFRDTPTTTLAPR